MDSNVTEEEIFTGMPSHSMLQLAFLKPPFVESWCSLKEEYPQSSEEIIKILLPFSTNYICEIIFSSHASIKTIYYNRLNTEADMKI